MLKIDTDWRAIVSLYETLMTIRPSPIVALNRAIAVAQNEGPERGLEEICAITDRERLASYPFYAAAHVHFRAAQTLARNPMERRFLDQRITACERGDAPQAYYERL